MNLGRGKFGENIAGLIAGMIVSRIKNAAMARINIPEEERTDFFLYVDEFQNIASENSDLGLCWQINMLSSLKTKRCLAGIPSWLRFSEMWEQPFVTGWALTTQNVCKKSMLLHLDKYDFVNLPDKGACYVNIKSGGERPLTFSMQTMGQSIIENPGLGEKIRTLSSLKYGIPIEIADANLRLHDRNL